ncbi:Up-regulated during septation-domain-containing protein [Amylocystis lapponica]|nr:Up-regulated during septation-domain-containing protein [Amylocystis lapponica]
MNGVRRFLTGGGAPTSQQVAPATEPVLSPPAQSPPQDRPSWPPSPVQSPTESLSPAGSPKMATAALFFRKDKPRPPLPLQSSTSSISSNRAAEDVTNGNASFQSSRSSVSPVRSQASSAQVSSPVAGPSSPRGPLPSRVSELSRKPVDRSNGDVNRASGLYSTRDDLLFSLLASEAIVDSRSCEILSAEEVEELKKEHQVLAARLVAVTKKLSLETKIRDAALSLSKANASYKNVTKQTSEQLDAANRKVELAQREFWRVSERANEVQRKLLEHRAGVLSYSVRTLERKDGAQEASESSTSGYSTPNRGSQISRTPSSVTSVQTSSSKGRFDGAHFFAGHSDAVVPQLPRSPPTLAEVVALEEKLKAATAELESVAAKQVQAARELSLLKLEKEQIQTSLSMDLETAEDTISALEREVRKMEDMDEQLRALEDEREVWTQERRELEERRREVDTLERRLELLEEQSGEAAEIGAVLAAEREERSLAIASKEREVADIKAQWSADRAAWETEKRTLLDGAESKAQLAELSDSMRDLMQTHGILLASRDASLPGLVSSVEKHLNDLHTKLDASARAQDEWVVVRTKLEEDIRTGMDKREALFAEIDEARRARDEAKAQARDLESQLLLKEQSFMQVSNQGPVEYTGEAAKVVAILQPLWATLPSPEARAGRLGSRNFRPSSPGGSPVVARNNASLSEMDVRSLKNLYDPRGSPMTIPGGMFSVEAFAGRVQALIADDRALIERLIRFAQAHDLLKKNAERAQKLAQESNVALETYQKQVKMLEERNMALLSKQTALQDEVQRLQDAVDRILVEKLDVETQAAEQAETCRQLTDANNTLSARALMLASDAASDSDSVRKQMDAQLAECKASLARAEEEIETMRISQQTQQMALLEELNTVQTENTTLRAQLRKK